MKLEDAVRKSLTIDGVECSSVREFISKLEKAKNLSMVVYVNTKLVCSGPALLRSDNNWIIASADCQISFKESVSVDSIRVYIKQGSTELFESVTTNCNMIIPANDTLATFYVCLGNDAPYNELAKRVPESRFTPISVNRIPDTSFDDITSTLNDGADVTIDDPDDGGITVEPTTVQVMINTSAMPGPGDQPDSEITSYLYKYDSSSNTWQPNEWGSSLECNANGANFIIVGVYNPMKKVSVMPADGVANIEVSPAADNADIDNIKTETGAVAVYHISFMPTSSTSLIINVEDETEEP